MNKTLVAGLYDQLNTNELEDELALSKFESLYEDLDVELSHERLADELTEQLSKLLAEFKGEKKDKLSKQISFVNQLLAYSREQINGKYQSGKYTFPPKVLRAVHPNIKQVELPKIGLSQPWLFTAGKGSPSLLHELRMELASCQKVDILVSFIMVSGIRKIIDILKSITSADANGKTQTKIRIITTTYTGATEQKALDQLAELPGCEVRISHAGKRTKLHAKAWIFERDTGFSSAYVGSANLSHSAMVNGLEWTVKFTEKGQPSLYSRAQAHFETLWLDNEFQKYDPNDLNDVAKLKDSIKRESFGGFNTTFSSYLDVEPRSYQVGILAQLQDERSQGRMRNLLVAATGTGKTIMAALDYRAIAKAEGGLPKLLFVAHRKEILQQSIGAYRAVLKDNNFGDLLYGGREPDQTDHLFATIQSVLSKELLKEAYGTSYWQVVVIDECHHIEAASFKRFVETITPKYLLGLTATPERADGKSILQHFDNRPDGTPAAQLRLWQALDDQLLAPFEYYACDDGVDYSEVPWKRTGEQAVLDNLLTGNHVRALAILRAWERLVSNPKNCKTLVFCVSVAHAQFMEKKLNDYGVITKSVTGTSSSEDRVSIPQQLKNGLIEAIVTVDLYNEGIDLPFVDTLLLLRPTQSITLFQQQIGRGLRHSDGKESCLVLDFVGQYRENFRFDLLYGSITGLSKKEVYEGIDKGFGKLPAGCHIQLEKQARENILSSLREAIKQNWKRLQTELLAHISLKEDRQTTLSDFLNEQQLELADIYKKKGGKSGWTNLKRAAELVQTHGGENEEYLSRKLAAITHIDDREYINLLKKVVNTIDTYKPDNAMERLQLLMFVYQVDIVSQKAITVEQALDRLRENPEIVKELGELCDYLDVRTQYTYDSLPEMDYTPLKLHASYEQREIHTAIGLINSEKRPFMGEGVWRDKDRKIEFLFVTIDKSDAVHEGIAYHDYAISSDRFHWQSQNIASAATPTGKRYIESNENGWSFQLFVRKNKLAPYRACGPVDFVEYHGAKPMNIIWKLKADLPVYMFEQYNVL